MATAVKWPAKGDRTRHRPRPSAAVPLPRTASPVMDGADGLAAGGAGGADPPPWFTTRFQFGAEGEAVAECSMAVSSQIANAVLMQARFGAGWGG